MKGGENMDEKYFYFITVFQKLPSDAIHFDIGNRRCWGFFCDKETAVKAVCENWTDLSEYLYNFAVVEEYREGLIGWTGNRWFFRFDAKKKRFFAIDEPVAFRHVGAFSIG